MEKKKKKSEREGKRVRVIYYIPTLGYSPKDSPQFSIEYSYLDSIKAVGENEVCFGGNKGYVFKVEPIED